MGLKNRARPLHCAIKAPADARVPHTDGAGGKPAWASGQAGRPPGPLLSASREIRSTAAPPARRSAGPLPAVGASASGRPLFASPLLVRSTTWTSPDLLEGHRAEPLREPGTLLRVGAGGTTRTPLLAFPVPGRSHPIRASAPRPNTADMRKGPLERRLLNTTATRQERIHVRSQDHRTIAPPPG